MTESTETAWRPYEPCREHELMAALYRYRWLRYVFPGFILIPRCEDSDSEDA